MLGVRTVTRRFCTKISCRDICRRIPLRFEHAANLAKNIEVISSAVLLVRVRNVSRQVDKHNTPAPGVRPDSGPNVNMLLSVCCPDAGNLNSLRIATDSQWSVERIDLVHRGPREVSNGNYTKVYP